MFGRLLTIMLTLAALATLALGVVSYWKGLPHDGLWINSAQSQPRFQVAMIKGVAYAVYAAPEPVGFANAEVKLGQFLARRVTVGQIVAVGIGVPFWCLFVVLALEPAAALLRGPVRRRRRRRRGECLHCGYNLTGLTEPRCPECGRQFARPAVGRHSGVG